MIYNVSMKLAHLEENEQAVAVFERFLPGVLQRMTANPQAASLSVEQLVRYTRIPQGEALLAKMDEALQALNTPENAVSPSEAKQIAAFQAIARQDQERVRPEPGTHVQHAVYPGQPWLDTKGERIQAHGGAVYYEDGVYYWYGENKGKRLIDTRSKRNT